MAAWPANGSPRSCMRISSPPICIAVHRQDGLPIVAPVLTLTLLAAYT